MEIISLHVYNVVTNKSITKNYYEICEPLLNRGRKVQSFPIKSGSSNVNIRAVDFEVAVTVLSFSCIVINNFGILLFGEV